MTTFSQANALRLGSLLLFLTLAPSVAAEEFEPRHVEFLEEVNLLMTAKERELYATLQTAAARDLFAKMFWEARDPTQGTSRNEAKEEHLRRISYARKRLSDDTPRDGIRTDRGRMYILLGEPIRVERYPNNHGVLPLELWFYSAKGNTRLPPYFYLLFFRPSSFDEYRMYVPGAQRPRDLMTGTLKFQMDEDDQFDVLRSIDPEVAYASISLDATKKSGQDRADASTFSQSVIAAVERLPEDTVNTSYLERFSPDGVIDLDHTFTYIDMDFEARAFVHEKGETHLHYGFQLLPKNFGVGQHQSRFYTSLLIAGTVTAGDGDPLVSLDDQVDIDLTQEQVDRVVTLPFAYLSRKFVLPGRYTLRFLMRNSTAQQYGRAEETLQIPDPKGKDLWLSPPLLISGVESAQAREDQLERPFQIGGLRLVPKLRPELHPEERAQVHSQLLVPAARRGSVGEWSTRLEIQQDGEVLSTQSSSLSQSTPGPAGTWHVIFPLPPESLPLGAFEVHLSIADRQGQKLISRSAPVDRRLDAAAPPWQSARLRPGALSFEARQEQARQLLRSGRANDAGPLLQALYFEQPDDSRLVYDLGEALLAAGQPQKIVSLVGPKASPLLYSSGNLSAPDQQRCLVMARALRDQEKNREAAAYLERLVAGVVPTPDLLVELGEVYVALGEPKQARSAWERSLQMEPVQPELKARLDALEP